MSGSPQFVLKALDHVVLRVEDVDRSVAFYRDVLGCSVEKVRDDIGLIQLRAGDCIIDLVDVGGSLGRLGGSAPGAEGHNLDHFCLRIEPFDESAIRDHFRAHGIETSRLRNNWGGDGRGPSLFVTDPTGNAIELKGPPTHRYDPAVGYVEDEEASVEKG